MAEPVVGGFLVGILEDVIRLVRFLELRFGVWIVGVAVGVQFLGLLAIGLFDRIGVGAFGDTEHIIVIAFCHGFPF